MISTKFNLVTMRKAESSDGESWIRMRRALWPECPDSGHELEVNQIFASNGNVFFVESSLSDIVGFVEVSLRCDHVEGTTTTPIPCLEGWTVDPSFRAMDIGKALVRSVEDFALQSGFTEIASDAEIKDPISIEIHKLLGFREAGRTVHRTFHKVVNRGE